MIHHFMEISLGDKDVMGDIEPTNQDYELGLPENNLCIFMDLFLGNAEGNMFFSTVG